jgi:hypothetical protein
VELAEWVARRFYFEISLVLVVVQQLVEWVLHSDFWISRVYAVVQELVYHLEVLGLPWQIDFDLVGCGLEQEWVCVGLLEQWEAEEGVAD